MTQVVKGFSVLFLVIILFVVGLLLSISPSYSFGLLHSSAAIEHIKYAQTRINQAIVDGKPQNKVIWEKDIEYLDREDRWNIISCGESSFRDFSDLPDYIHQNASKYESSAKNFIDLKTQYNDKIKSGQLVFCMNMKDKGKLRHHIVTDWYITERLQLPSGDSLHKEIAFIGEGP
jgi:hypothetical protein